MNFNNWLLLENIIRNIHKLYLSIIKKTLIKYKHMFPDNTDIINKYITDIKY